MFNDRYGLTQAVLDGRKTQTRRIISERLWNRWTEYDGSCCPVGVSGLSAYRVYYDCAKFFLDNSPYHVGEVVAVAQRYSDFMEADKVLYRTVKEVDGYRRELASEQKGWNNKLFVCADLMPHRIHITDVRVERLQDICWDNCFKEGIYIHDEDPMNPQAYLYAFPNSPEVYYHPREAYAALIDKISGRGTWESNPYVFVYTFELVK